MEDIKQENNAQTLIKKLEKFPFDKCLEYYNEQRKLCKKRYEDIVQEQDRQETNPKLSTFINDRLLALCIEDYYKNTDTTPTDECKNTIQTDIEGIIAAIQQQITQQKEEDQRRAAEEEKRQKEIQEQEEVAQRQQDQINNIKQFFTNIANEPHTHENPLKDILESLYSTTRQTSANFARRNNAPVASSPEDIHKTKLRELLQKIGLIDTRTRKTEIFNKVSNAIKPTTQNTTHKKTTDPYSAIITQYQNLGAIDQAYIDELFEILKNEKYKPLITTEHIHKQAKILHTRMRDTNNNK